MILGLRPRSYLPWVPNIDVGTRGHWGHVPPRFAITQEVPFLFLENASFSFRKKCPQSVVAPKFEMHPTSLVPKPCY